MGKFGDLLSEDTNQFGPGTDLTVSLLAVMLVISLITSHLYSGEKIKREEAEQQAADSRKAADLAKQAEQAKAEQLARLTPPELSGNFKLAGEFFTAADFHARPVTRHVDRRATMSRVSRIVADYRRSSGDYPYIFVIGHSSALDDPDARDRSAEARRRRNMEYALRRAALIADLLQEQLSDDENNRLVAASTGEFDLKNTSDPLSQENAWVEVVFGREWKLPGRSPAQ